MFENSCLAGRDVPFHELGTGRMKKKVVVVNQDGRILFTARILKNHPSTGILLFDNRKILKLRTGSLGNEKVRIFFWTEVLDRRLIWQTSIEEIEGWMESARPEDIVAFSGCVAHFAGYPEAKWSFAWVYFAKQQIRERLRKLDFLHIQQLRAIVFCEPQRMAA